VSRQRLCWIGGSLQVPMALKNRGGLQHRLDWPVRESSIPGLLMTSISQHDDDDDAGEWWTAFRTVLRCLVHGMVGTISQTPL
jgi:hypothetical protein